MTARLGGVVVLDYLSSSPAAPAAGSDLVYAKTDDRLYTKSAADVESRIDFAPEDTGWVACTYNNSWTTFSGWPAAAARRINGVVYLRGLLAPGTGWGSQVQICTLPAGYAPDETMIFTCIAGYAGNNVALSTTASPNHLHYYPLSQTGVRIDVAPTGGVFLSTVHVAGGSPVKANPAHVDIFGCHWVQG